MVVPGHGKRLDDIGLLPYRTRRLTCHYRVSGLVQLGTVHNGHDLPSEGRQRKARSRE